MGRIIPPRLCEPEGGDTWTYICRHTNISRMQKVVDIHSSVMMIVDGRVCLIVFIPNISVVLASVLLGEHVNVSNKLGGTKKHLGSVTKGDEWHQSIDCVRAYFLLEDGRLPGVRHKGNVLDGGTITEHLLELAIGFPMKCIEDFFVYVVKIRVIRDKNIIHHMFSESDGRHGRR